MLNMQELKELANFSNGKGYFVSCYLNVDPIFNKKGDYILHLKNMIKKTIESLDKSVYKRVKEDLEKIEHYVLTNKRLFKKGLAIFSSKENSLWREYNLGVPVKNELIVDKTIHTKPLSDLLDNYQRYGVLLVGKDVARIFIIHLGEIVEYGEVTTADIPGKHKKGGWFALAQNHYERHINVHVGMHLKDVVEKLDSFLALEYVGRLILGGSDEAVSMVKTMLRKPILDKVIGSVKVEMFAKSDEVLAKVEPLVSAYERMKEDDTVKELIAKAMKNEAAVIGLENVLNALQEQRVMKLVLLSAHKQDIGWECKSCGFLTMQKIISCPYCKGEFDAVDNIIDVAIQKAIQQGALVEVVQQNDDLANAGGIGAFLRF
ncbi:MAG: Vms1/Ankzf1 family peptidyl-tRNA hydrolase [Thermodesulfovibrionales bacterium]|nr:Vms1/Ankzf1 family peptidyl-tRNA hydrolase [Thermodesulfovibrionales bacterium]